MLDIYYCKVLNSYTIYKHAHANCRSSMRSVMIRFQVGLKCKIRTLDADDVLSKQIIGVGGEQNGAMNRYLVNNYISAFLCVLKVL